MYFLGLKKMALYVTSNVKIIVFFARKLKCGYPDDADFASLFIERKYGDVTRISFSRMRSTIESRIENAVNSDKKVTFVISDVNSFRDEALSIFKNTEAVIVKISYKRRSRCYAYDDFYKFDVVLGFVDYFEFCDDLSTIYENLKRGKRRFLDKTEVVNTKYDDELIKSCLLYFETVDSKNQLLDKKYILNVEPLHEKRMDIQNSLKSFIRYNSEDIINIPDILLNDHLSRFLFTQRGFSLSNNSICFMGVDIRNKKKYRNLFYPSDAEKKIVGTYFNDISSSLKDVYILTYEYFGGNYNLPREGEFELEECENDSKNIYPKAEAEKGSIEFLYNITQAICSMAKNGLLIRYPDLQYYS